MINFPNEDAKWAWLAGLFEGEGCLSIDHRCRHQIVLSNTNRELLEMAQQIGGGKIYIFNPEKNRKRGWTPSFFLFVLGRENQLKLLSKINPFLLSKRRQAELIIELIELRISGKNRITTPRYDEIYLEMKTLNQNRGKKLNYGFIGNSAISTTPYQPHLLPQTSRIRLRNQIS